MFLLLFLLMCVENVRLFVKFICRLKIGLLGGFVGWYVMVFV